MQVIDAYWRRLWILCVAGRACALYCRWMRRRVCTAAVAFLVTVAAGAMVLGPSAASAGGWLPPQSVSVANRYAGSGALTVNEAGRTTMIGRFQTPGVIKSRVMSASRPLGGGWTAAAEAVAGDQVPYAMTMKSDAHGNALAAWANDDDRLGVTIRTAWRSAAGVWAPFEDISLDGDSMAFGPDIAFHADGSATVIWSQLMIANLEEASDEVIRVKRRSPDGQWSAGTSLTPIDGRASTVPQLALDGDGALYATWELYNASNDTWQIQVARQPEGGAWQAAETLSSPDEWATRPALAVDDAGNVTVAWSAKDAAGIGRIYTARRESGEWSSPLELWNGGPHFLLPVAAIGAAPDGRVTVAWGSSLENGPDSGRTIRARQRAADGSWSATTALAPADGHFDLNATWPVVEVDDDGRALVAWSGWVNGRYQVRAAVSSLDGGWEAATTVSNAPLAAGRPQVVVDHLGHFTVAWRNDDGPNVVTATRVFDPVPPSQTAVNVPATATVGDRLSATVAASDVWSSVASRWDFGDGTTATGDVVQHCYRQPGEHEVRVTSTDAAGNATSTTRDVIVTAGAGDRSCDPPPPLDPGPPPADPPGDPKPPVPDPAPKGDPPPAVPRENPGRNVRAAVALRGLRVTPTRWATRRSQRSRPVGTTFEFRLNRAAAVRLEVVRETVGRRTGGRCRAASAANRSRPACTRRLSMGAVRVAGRSGQNEVAFRGRIGRRTLAPGRYRVRVSAAAGGRTARGTVTFRVVR